VCVLDAGGGCGLGSKSLLTEAWMPNDEWKLS